MNSTHNNDARLARLAENCEDHRMQAKLTDPVTNESRWVCEGCGGDCGAA